MSSVPTTNLHITPSNVLSSGRISYVSGNPVIQFIIGEQARGLLGSSVRLCGNLSMFQDSARTALSGETLNINPRLGAYGMIDQLVIKSQKTHAVIEHIRHYSRMMASFLPYTANLEDNMGHQSESALTMPNMDLMRKSVVEIPSVNTTKNNFCMHLPCGLFNGTSAIPLDTTGGLLIEIHLAPDSNFLFDSTGASTTYPSAFYELSDVFLAAEAEVATPSPGPGTFEYNSVSSYFTSFNSTNAIINFNLGLSNVLSVFANLIPASHINNIGFDGMATLPPTNSNGKPGSVSQCILTRGGEKFPLEYNVDTIQTGDTTFFDQRTLDSQLTREGMSAVRKFAKMSRTLANPTNTFIKNYGTSGGAVNTQINENDIMDGGSCFILGVNYDAISNQGVSFATQNWGMNLTTNLVTDFPHAVFLFVHSKNTLVFDGQGGMQVMS
tara:strand:+ start:9461 stop:10780 length:1320 start_codon:yes stop_codon:yes gene_type:complete